MFRGVQVGRVLPEVRPRALTPAPTRFYMWYFTLTGIHLTHVVVGTRPADLFVGSGRDAAPTTTCTGAVPECVAS